MWAVDEEHASRTMLLAWFRSVGRIIWMYDMCLRAAHSAHSSGRNNENRSWAGTPSGRDFRPDQLYQPVSCVGSPRLPC